VVNAMNAPNGMNANAKLADYGITPRGAHRGQAARDVTCLRPGERDRATQREYERNRSNHREGGVNRHQGRQAARIGKEGPEHQRRDVACPGAGRGGRDASGPMLGTQVPANDADDAGEHERLAQDLPRPH
jgi:hypothetical protein